MYHFKEVTIQNKQKTKEENVLVIEFTDPSMAIVGEFLMTDASLVNNSVLSDIEDIIACRSKSKTVTGNRCSLEIKRDQTIISDLFEDMFDGLETYPTYEIGTKQLRNLIVMWKKEKDKFNQKEKDE